MHTTTSKILSVVGANSVPVALWLSQAQAVMVVLSATAGLAYTLVMFYDRFKKKK